MSETKSNWFTRLGSLLGGKCTRQRSRPATNRLRLEQLESRRVFAAVLLEFPGIDGDATVSGASATDMELSSFKWGFSRDQAGARASLSDPIEFKDLTFQRSTDSASNELYAQAALQTLSASPARLRVVDNGVNLLRFDLNNSRLTKFVTSEGQKESGALSFSNLAFTESSTPTPRTASWNLLSGAASSSPIVGQTNIDPSSNALNIETVMQIGNEKMLIDGFSWSANLDVDMTLANPLSGLAKGSNFQITRGVDSATAGLLGSAASRTTTFPEIRISDRSVIAGNNRITMEWKLYDAFFAGFELEASTGVVLKNNLELSYGRIELVVNQFNSSGVLTNTETTTWNEAGNIVNATNDFGVPNPLLVDNTSNPTISSLNFAVPVGSPVGTPNLGRLAYESIDWSVSNSISLVNPATSARLGAMTVTLPDAQLAPAPALLGQLAQRTQLNAVNAFEKNTLDPTSALDTFGLTNVFVTGFSVKNAGLQGTLVKFDMDFRSFSETFTDRTTPASPLINRANFNVQTQTSTSVPSFGGQTIDTLFELVITQAGVTSEIPLQSAKWGVSRGATFLSYGGLETSNPEQTSFNIEVPRGVYSPGLLAAAVRGTQIDEVTVRRYEVGDVNGTLTKKEVYRWDLGEIFITGVVMDMRPGNSSEEVDSISFLPSGVELVTPNPDPDPQSPREFKAGWDFVTGEGLNTSSDQEQVNDLTAENPALRYKLDDAAQGIAIDSYQWGATLPVDSADSSGTRLLGNPSPNSLLLKASRNPSPRFLAQALFGELKQQTIALPIPADNPTSPSNSYDLRLFGLPTGYSYSDELTANRSEIGFSIFVGGGPNTAELQVTPLNTDGTSGTTRRVTWNVLNDTTTNFSGLGNFQFATNLLPATTLQLFDGTSGAQLAVDSYTFGIDNALNQLVGTSTAAAPLASRGNPTARTFNVTTSMDRATPGLINAIATKTLIPEMKITERRAAPNGQFLPWREWVLTNVYVEVLGNSGTAEDPQGEVKLELNAASARATYIKYNSASTPTSLTKRLNFADVPAISPATINAISTEADRVISVVSRFTDPQLQYTTTVVSGANLFDGVSLNAQNQLVLNFKPGQRGVGQVRVNGLNAFGLASSFSVTVNLDDGSANAPEGTDKTVTFNEDTIYTIRTSDFGFTDPNDLPANALSAVRIASLPVRGSLTLNNIPVTLNQSIPVASLNLNQLRYRPAANGQGTNYASFTFQVQDNAATANLDLTPNLFTFNVTNTNDAPTFTRTNIATLAVNEDSTNPISILVSQIANAIQDIDPGALRGIAIVNAPNTLGTWQYALDGSTWQSLTGSSVNAARLLAADATTRVRFLPNANASGTSALGLHAWDRIIGQPGGIGNFTEFAQFRTFSTASATLGVNVRPINDAPTIAAPNVASAIFGTPLVFSSADANNAITIADIDAAAGEVQVTISVTSGQFTLSTLEGITIMAGSNGSSALSARGTLAALNNALEGSTFTPGLNSAVLQMVVDDLGNTGGGALSSSRTIELSVSLPSSLVNLGALDATTPTIRRSDFRSGLTIANLYVFSIAATSDVRVTLSGLSADLDLRVLDAGGDLFGLSVENGNAIEDILLTALPAGIYLVDVRRFFTTAFDLTVSIAPTSDDLITEAVLLPSPSAASLPTVREPTGSNSADLHDYFRFEMTTASALRINLSGLLQDVDFELLDSLGRVIQSASAVGNEIVNMLTSTLAVGTYFVRVFAFDGQLTSSYDLTMSINTTSDDLLTNATSLGFLGSQGSVRRTGNVAVGVDIQDYYVFAAGGELAISVSGLSSDVDFQVLDGFGVPLAQSSRGGNTAESIIFTIPEGSGGSIFVRIHAFAGSSNYVFEARRNSNEANADDLFSTATPLPTPLTSLTRTGAVGGTGASGDPQDYYRFQLTSIRSVTVTLSGLSADLDIEVLDQFGSVLFFSRNGGSNSETISMLNLAIGTYFIRIHPFGSAVSNYTLGLTVV